MISFDLNFFPRPETLGEGMDNFENILEWWLSSLYRNGNVLVRNPFVYKENQIQVRVMTLALDALERQNWDRFADKDLQRLEPLFLSAFNFERVGDLPVKSAWCQCSASSGRMLFTTFLDDSSPVRCLDCQNDVPLYSLPISPNEVDRFPYRCWQEDYKAIDRLWMDSGVGERFAYRQIARSKSDFMTRTCELATSIEKASHVPTYSFLLHHHKKWGKRCPLCGSKWRWKNSTRSLFAFKCDHCRLISSEASDEAKRLRELHP